MKTVAETSARSASRRIDWSAYLAGVDISVLSWVAFAVAKEPLGVTTAYSRVASLFAVPILGANGAATPIGRRFGSVWITGWHFLAD
jgi:hypothetical protein